MNVSMIACIGANSEIGKDNKLLIRNKEDLSWFKEKTMNKTIVFGRKTYESLNKRMLKGRNIIVLTRNKYYNPHPNIKVRHSVEDIMDQVQSENEIIICGGQKLYEEFLPIANILYLTKVHNEFEADTYFPKINKEDWKEIYFRGNREYCKFPITFHIYERRI